MGWVMLALIGAGAFGGLALLGVPRLLWSIAAAALMLGAVGYALQGRPWLGSTPAIADVGADADSPDLIDLRDRMLGRYTGDAAYVTAADAMTRAGDRRAAVRAILGGINAIPESVLLWTALGNTLSAHDGGQVSPPALFAFRQAARLSPRHPGPPFFLGQAYIREGNFAAARLCWARALALAPPRASYRADIAERLMVLDRYMAMAAAGGVPR